MPPRTRFYGWWFLSISAGFVLLLIRGLLVGHRAWLSVIRAVIAVGFLILGWQTLRRGRRLGLAVAVLALAGAAEAAPAYRAGSVARPDGATIAYYERDGRGRAAAPPLVLIPGSWGDYRVFDRLVENLPRALRVIVVELRGHGRSQPATLDPSMGGFAEDVLSVVDKLELKRFFVGGHSIGGMLAIEIAGRRPAAVAGVIAIEGWTHHEVARDAFGGDVSSTMTPAQQKLNAAQRERVRKRLTEAEIAAFASVWRRWDGLPILETTPAPVLEIWGDRGRPRPSRAVMRIPERPSIRLVWIAGASHSLLIERPEEVARAITAFLREVAIAPVSAE